MQRIILSILASLILASCAVQSDVSRVHTLPDSLAGKTFFIRPSNAQQGRAEFGMYARDVAEELAAKGMVERPDATGTDYAVMFSYDVDKGRVTSTTRRTITQQIDEEFANEDDDTRERLTETFIESEKVYKRTFRLSLIDVAKSGNMTDKMVYAYEGTLISEGSADAFMPVSKCMIKSLFQDFPGRSGSTNTTMIQMENCKR